MIELHTPLLLFVLRSHLVNTHRFKKQYVEPRLDEGFTEIKPITFVPHFDNPDQEKLFHQLT